MRRISVSKRRNGVNFSHAFPHSFTDQLVVQRLRRHSLCRLGGLGLGHVLTGHRCIFHDQEYTERLALSRNRWLRCVVITGGGCGGAGVRTLLGRVSVS